MLNPLGRPASRSISFLAKGPMGRSAQMLRRFTRLDSASALSRRSL